MGYDLSVTNGFECPSQYTPPSDDCKTVDQSVWTDLIWLWIILGVCWIKTHMEVS